MIAAILTAAHALVGCTDPVESDRVASLGGETDGVPRGPTHRAGQPCTWCHNGSEEREFTLAGTVFDTLSNGRPVQGARVTVTDATDKTVVVETNCAGNFFIRPETFRPVFPVRTKISFGSHEQTMESLIHRESSCAACHATIASRTSPGPVFLFETPPDNVPGGCP
jgi:hypothetical protein